MNVKVLNQLKDSITIKANTQKAQNIIERYYNSCYKTLNDVYKTYSNEKLKSYNNILKRKDEQDGYRFRILGGNSSFYSCAYSVDFGDQIWLIFDTALNTYKIQLK